MSETERQLQLQGVPDDLPRVAALLDELCEVWGLAPGSCFDLQLAIEEACTNVMEHAYGGRGGGYRVKLEARAGDFVVTLQDNGRRFDASAIPAPDFSVPLEERRIGGLGVHLMKKLMDKVEFSYSPEHGNTLVMVKRKVVLKGPGSAA